MISKPGKKEYAILALQFFLLWSAPGLWTVCFSNVLRSHGLENYIAYAFACNAIAAFISPLFVGAMADHSVAPSKLLRWLNWGSALFLGLCFFAIDMKWGGPAVISLMLCYALCTSPNISLITSIALSRLENPSKNFGPLRTWGTIGWAFAGWFISWVLQADSSTLSGYAAAVTLALTGFLSFLLPETKPQTAGQHRSWKERLGLDALALARHHDHRIVFLTTALFSIPLAAFFPFAPMQLKELGADKPTALMALGQVSEIFCLLLLSRVLSRVRLKWIFLGGIFFGALRYGLFTLESQTWMILGIAMHGLCYTLFFITGQLYLAERIDKSMQTRAQALLSLMTNGVGNLSGYLFTGWWWHTCTSEGKPTSWPLYWWGLTLFIVAVGTYFFFSYHGAFKGTFRSPSKQAS